VLDHTDLIIPDVYDPDVLSAVRWLQEHLPFSDEYLAQLIGASTELFSEWKTGAQTLTDFTDGHAGKSLTSHKSIVVILQFPA
jgi:hypothetical protein